jgi:hypothetical protein
MTYFCNKCSNFSQLACFMRDITYVLFAGLVEEDQLFGHLDLPIIILSSLSSLAVSLSLSLYIYIYIYIYIHICIYTHIYKTEIRCFAQYCMLQSEYDLTGRRLETHQYISAKSLLLMDQSLKIC